MGSNFSIAGCLLLGRPFAAGGSDAQFDVVILPGRVMDPETNLDAIRNVGISGGKIREISEKELHGKEVIEARGLVVAPGCIDLHQHGQAPKNYEFEAHDGVPTTLELEAGTKDVDQWYAEREGKSPINFGVSVGHIPVRMSVMNDPGTFLPTGDAAHREATEDELKRIDAGMEQGLRHGALAVGMWIKGWQDRQGITYKDIQWTKTGERLTAETFAKYRKEGGVVVIFSIPRRGPR